MPYGMRSEYCTRLPEDSYQIPSIQINCDNARYGIFDAVLDKFLSAGTSLEDVSAIVYSCFFETEFSKVQPENMGGLGDEERKTPQPMKKIKTLFDDRSMILRPLQY